MIIRVNTFEVLSCKNFGETLPRRAGMGRSIRDKLLKTFQNGYHDAGIANATRGRVNARHTDLRNEAGPRRLKRPASGMAYNPATRNARLCGKNASVLAARGQFDPPASCARTLNGSSENIIMPQIEVNSVTSTAVKRQGDLRGVK